MARPTGGSRRAVDERGYVLLWALFAFVVLSGLATAALRVTGSERRLAKAATGWNTSFYAAEGGLPAALSVVGDTLLAGLAPGDSVDLGWRSLGGSTEYRAVFHRIDDGGDDLYLLRSTGRHQGIYGGQTTVSLAFSLAEDTGGGVVSNHELTVEGKLTIGGGCTVHANDWIYISGEINTNGVVSSGGSVQGAIEGLDEEALAQLALLDDYAQQVADGDFDESDPEVRSFDARLAVAPVQPVQMCGQADFTVHDGWVVSAERGDSAQVGTGPAASWSQPQPGLYEVTGSPEPGTYCVDGSVRLAGNVGTPAAPAELSVLADGFIDASGNPFVEAEHAEDVLFAADGDVRLDGSSDPLAPNYRGDIFAASQCAVYGSPSLVGRLTCRGDLDPPGTPSIISQIVIIGDLDVIAACGGGLASVAKPLDQRAWALSY